MKKTKKFLSILLCIALVASFIPSFSLVSQADSYPVELVENGSFNEASISDQWDSNNATVFETASNENRGGSGYSLKIGTNSTWHDSYLTVNAKASTTYMISFVAKSSNGQFQYYVNDEEGAVLYAKKAVSCNNSWQQVSFTVNTLETTEQIKITFNLKVTAAYIDCVSVMDITPASTFSLTFDDGKLPDNTTLYAGDVTVTDDGAYSGYSLRIAGSNWNSWASIAIPVTPGQSYRLSFVSKATNNVSYQYKVGTDMWGNNPLNSYSGACTSAYYKNSLVFTANEGQYKAWLYFKSSGNSIYIDNITVDAIASANVDANAIERVVDGSFENGISAQWTATSQIKLETNQHVQGSNSLQINNANSWKDLYLNVTVKPNTKYLISFKYNFSDGSSSDKLQYYIDNGSGDGTEGSAGNIVPKTAVTIGGSGWKTFQKLVEVPEDTTTLRLTLNTFCRLAYLDCFSIAEILEPEAVANGSFENGELDTQWTNVGSGYALSTDRAATGNYSLKYTPAGAKAWVASGLTVSVIPGKTYIVSFKEYSTNWRAQFQWMVGTSFWNTSLIAKSGNLNGDQKWVTYSGSFTVPENTYQVTLTLNSTCTDGTAHSTYFDDISICEASTVTLQGNIEGAGEFTGAGIYKVGESVTVNAVNNSGYAFAGWYNGDELVSTDMEYTFEATEDITLTANFSATSNLIANDSFETGNWNWNKTYVPYKWEGANWSHIEASTDAHTGKYAVHFKDNPDTTELGVLRQVVENVDVNTIYSLSFWVKMYDNQNDAVYKINGIEIDSLNGEVGEWKEISYQFNTGSSTSIKFEIVSTKSDFAVDDFVLIKSTAKGIINGDFESGAISGWNWHKDTSVTIDSTHAIGSYAAKFVDTEWRNATNLTAVIVPNKIYSLSFKVYREEADSNFNLTVSSGIDQGLYGSVGDGLLAGDGSVNGWVTVRAAFKSDVDTVKLLINHNGTLWFDDFVISDITPGDADMNGSINIVDLVRMKKYSAAGPGTNNYVAGDTDNDGSVNAEDLLYLKKLLLGITDTEVAETTRYAQIMAEDGFVYGISVPWFTYDDQGHNLSSNLLKGYDCTYDHDTAYNILYNCKAIGFNAVNIWLFSGLEGIEFDENCVATGLKDDFVANLTDVLEIATDLDLGMTLTIQPHLEGLKDTGYYGILTDSAKQTAYLNNVVNPVLELAAQYKDIIVSTVAYCEPDIDVKLGAATVAQAKALTSAIAAASKSVLTDVPVGVAFSMVVAADDNYSDFVNLQNDANIDYLGYDYYNDNYDSVPVPQWNCDTMLTECSYQDIENVDEAVLIQNIFNKAKSAGYKGAYYWTYSSDTLALVNRDGSYSNAIGAAYKLIRTARNDFAENEAPVVLYDKNQIVVLANPTAEEYVIEKWDSAAGWTEVDYLLNPYEDESAIVSYTVDAVDNGYYRVGAYYGENCVYTLIPNTLQ